MSAIQLGKDLKLPLETATQAMTVLGLRGSGKTNTGGVLVEELLDAGQPVAVIDPLDVWWGLRSSIDGTREGYPVLVMGGPHGQLPLEQTHGKTVAQFIVEERVPVILSLRHMRKTGQRQFVRDLAEELYHLKGRPQYRQPLTVVIDEAPLFIPQTKTSDLLPLVGAIEDLAARGRSSGFGVVIISQRSATITKDVLSQSGIIVAHRLTAPQDKKALREWFEENADVGKLQEILSSLAELKDGEAWVWAPAFQIFKRTQIRLRKTFDSSATPKAGKKLINPRRLAEIDLDSLKGRMAEVAAKAKAEDPAAIKTELANLKRQLEAAQAKTAKPVVEKQIVPKIEKVPMLSDKQIERYCSTVDKAADAIVKASNDLRDAISKHTLQASKLLGLNSAPLPGNAGHVVKRPPSLPGNAGQKPVSPPRAQMPSGDGDLSGGSLQILQAAIQFGNPTREELSVITGYKRSSRDTFIQRLSSAGYVTTDNGRIEPTEEGRAKVPDFSPLPTGSALQAFWLERLSGGEHKILSALLQAPQGLSPDDLSEQTGYQRSSRDTFLQRLGGRRLVVRERGLVKPSPMLFD